MTVYTEQHKSSLNALVTLFTLDATEIGGATYYFTAMSDNAGGSPFGPQKIVWKTHTYEPMPITLSGAKSVGSGALPKPTLTISNIDGTIFAAVLSLGDLVGAELIVEKTFEQFLDNGLDPNTSAVLPTEIYVVEQKTVHNREIISWTLASYLDRNNVLIPRRQVLRDAFPGISTIRLR